MNFEQEISELKNRLSKIENIGNNPTAIAEISIGVMKWIQTHETELKELSTDLSPDANPREVAELITDGKIPPRHIGVKTKEVLIQEIYSLMNTKKMFRDEAWNERFYTRVIELEHIAPDEYGKVISRIRQQFTDIENALEAFKTRTITSTTSKTSGNEEPQREA